MTNIYTSSYLSTCMAWWPNPDPSYRMSGLWGTIVLDGVISFEWGKVLSTRIGYFVVGNGRDFRF